MIFCPVGSLPGTAVTSTVCPCISRFQLGFGPEGWSREWESPSKEEKWCNESFLEKLRQTHLYSKAGHRNIHMLRWLNICMGSERHLPFGDFRPNHSCCFKLQKNNENRVHLEGTEWHLLINLTHSPVLKVSVAPFKEICPVHGTRDQVWAGGEISTSTILPLPPPPFTMDGISLSGAIPPTYPHPHTAGF